MPPRALAVLLTGFFPGLTITASVFVLRVVAPLLLDVAFVPAIGISSWTRIGLLLPLE